MIEILEQRNRVLAAHSRPILELRHGESNAPLRRKHRPQPGNRLRVKHQIGVTPYQVLQGGLLTGKYRRGEPLPADSRAAEKPDWVWKTDDALFDKLEGLNRIATEASVPPTQFAIAWTLAQPAMTSMIVGAKRVEQIEDAVQAAEVKLSSEILAKVDTVVPPPWKQPDPVRG